MSWEIAEIFRNYAGKNMEMASLFSEPFVRTGEFAITPSAGRPFNHITTQEYIGSCAYYLTKEGDSGFGCFINDEGRWSELAATVKFVDSYDHATKEHHTFWTSLPDDKITQGAVEIVSEDVMAKTEAMGLRTIAGVVVSMPKKSKAPIAQLVVPRRVVEDITAQDAKDVRSPEASEEARLRLLAHDKNDLLRRQYGISAAVGLLPTAAVVQDAFGSMPAVNEYFNLDPEQQNWRLRLSQRAYEVAQAACGNAAFRSAVKNAIQN